MIVDEGILWRAKSGPYKGELVRIRPGVAAGIDDTCPPDEVFDNAKANDSISAHLLEQTPEGLINTEEIEVRKGSLERVIQVVTWETYNEPANTEE